MRIFGPCRSCRTATGRPQLARGGADAARWTAAWSSWLPWEKLRRATSTPGSRSCCRIVGGPSGGTEGGDDLGAAHRGLLPHSYARARPAPHPGRRLRPRDGASYRRPAHGPRAARAPPREAAVDPRGGEGADRRAPPRRPARDDHRRRRRGWSRPIAARSSSSTASAASCGARWRRAPARSASRSARASPARSPPRGRASCIPDAYADPRFNRGRGRRHRLPHPQHPLRADARHPGRGDRRPPGAQPARRRLHRRGRGAAPRARRAGRARHRERAAPRGDRAALRGLRAGLGGGHRVARPDHRRPLRSGWLAHRRAGPAPSSTAPPPAWRGRPLRRRRSSSRSATPPCSTTSARSGVREHVLVKADKLYPHELELLAARFELARAAAGERAAPGAARAGAAEAGLDERLRRSWTRFWEVVLALQPPHGAGPGGFGALAELAEPHLRRPARRRARRCSTPARAAPASPSPGARSPTSERRGDREPRHPHLPLPLADPLDARPAPRARDRLRPPREARRPAATRAPSPRRAIPVETRMMTIADIFDALTASDRPYKKAVPAEKALDILRDEAKRRAARRPLLGVFVEAQASGVRCSPGARWRRRAGGFPRAFFARDARAGGAGAPRQGARPRSTAGCAAPRASSRPRPTTARDDRASHARFGPTRRAAIMFGAARRSLRLPHLRHVPLPERRDRRARACPSAVLVRAGEPVEGCLHSTRGPGNLCRALAITRERAQRPRPRGRRALRRGRAAAGGAVARDPRVNVDYAGAWAGRPCRYLLVGNPWVSGRRSEGAARVSRRRGRRP